MSCIVQDTFSHLVIPWTSRLWNSNGPCREPPLTLVDPVIQDRCSCGDTGGVLRSVGHRDRLDMARRKTRHFLA